MLVWVREQMRRRQHTGGQKRGWRVSWQAVVWRQKVGRRV
jgi:hypothetical protein